MATGDRRLNIQDKMLITTIGLEDHFFDFIYKQTRDFIVRTFPASGIFAGTGTISSSSPDIFEMSALEGLWLDGYWAQVPFTSNIPFENDTGVDYYVGVNFVEVPTVCQIRPLTSTPEYTAYEEQVGEFGNPTEAHNNGQNLIINVDSVTESGVSHEGRIVRIYKTQPTTTAIGWYEDCVIQYGTSASLYSSDTNYIETIGLLGQLVGYVSENPLDYQCWLQGVSVFKNTDLSDRPTYPEYIYLGKMTGNAGGSPSFDYSNVTIYALDAIELSYIRDFVGKQTALPEVPSYASIEHISQGDDLVGAISDLDPLISEAASDGGDGVKSLARRAESMARTAESQSVLDNVLADYAEDRSVEAKSIADSLALDTVSEAKRGESLGRRAQEHYIQQSVNPADYEIMENWEFIDTSPSTLNTRVLRRWVVGRPGMYRIFYEAKVIAGQLYRVDLYKNGIYQFMNNMHSSTIYSFSSFYIELAAYDKIELKGYKTSGTNDAYVKSFRIALYNTTKLIKNPAYLSEEQFLEYYPVYDDGIGSSTTDVYKTNTVSTSSNSYITVRSNQVFRSGKATILSRIRTSSGAWAAYVRLRIVSIDGSTVYDEAPYNEPNYTYMTVADAKYFKVRNLKVGDIIHEELKRSGSAVAYSDSFYVQARNFTVVRGS